MFSSRHGCPQCFLNSTRGHVLIRLNKEYVLEAKGGVRKLALSLAQTCHNEGIYLDLSYYSISPRVMASLTFNHPLETLKIAENPTQPKHRGGAWGGRDGEGEGGRGGC